MLAFGPASRRSADSTAPPPDRPPIHWRRWISRAEGRPFRHLRDHLLKHPVAEQRHVAGGDRQQQKAVGLRSRPNLGCCHCSSASKPAMRPVGDMALPLADDAQLVVSRTASTMSCSSCRSRSQLRSSSSIGAGSARGPDWSPQRTGRCPSDATGAACFLAMFGVVEGRQRKRGNQLMVPRSSERLTEHLTQALVQSLRSLARAVQHQEFIAAESIPPPAVETATATIAAPARPATDRRRRCRDAG